MHLSGSKLARPSQCNGAAFFLLSEAATQRAARTQRSPHDTSDVHDARCTAAPAGPGAGHIGAHLADGGEEVAGSEPGDVGIAGGRWASWRAGAEVVGTSANDRLEPAVRSDRL